MEREGSREGGEQAVEGILDADRSVAAALSGSRSRHVTSQRPESAHGTSRIDKGYRWTRRRGYQGAIGGFGSL
ncbi:hypothetical protein ANTQUA_LOCUS10176 [Anthophora quadrimaculata]